MFSSWFLNEMYERDVNKSSMNMQYLWGLRLRFFASTWRSNDFGTEPLQLAFSGGEATGEELRRTLSSSALN